MKSIKELEKLAQMCRKRGIAELKVTENEVEMKLWDHIPTQARRSKAKSPTYTKDNIELENLPTEEEVLFWSSAGLQDIAESKN